MSSSERTSEGESVPTRNFHCTTVVAILLAALGCCGPIGRAQYTSGQPDADSLAQAYERSLSSLTSPQLEERESLRRSLQQRGYASVVYDLCRNDPLSALLSHLRTAAQLRWFIPHTTLYVYLPVRQPPQQSRMRGFTGAPSPPIAVPLRDDWSFPEDPWRKD